MLNYVKGLHDGPWKIQKYIIMSQEIVYSTIISSQIILGIEVEKKTFFMVHFDEMLEGDSKKIDLNNKIELNSRKMKPIDKEMSQLITNLVKNNFDFSNRNLISCDFFHSSVYFLLNSEMYCLNLISWEQQFQAYREDEDYIQAMTNAIQIYKNKIKFLANIPTNAIKRREALTNSIKEIAVEYFLNSLKKLEEIVKDCLYVKEIATTIEFLIETEHHDFLFNNIMKDLELRGYLKQFFISLEPFIMKKKIR